MASGPRETADVVQFKDEVFSYTNRRIPPGSTVILRGNFEAEFDTGNPADLNKGWGVDHPMTEQPDGSFTCTVSNLEEGRNYKYKYFVTRPDGTTFEDPAGGPGKNRDRFIVLSPPPAPPSPSHTYSSQEVRTRVKARVAAVLEGGKTNESAKGLDDLVEQLAQEMRDLDLKGDQHVELIASICEAISEAPDLPEAIKKFFQDRNNPPKNFTEFRTRYEQGSNAFRKKVRLRLTADSKTRDLLHANPGDQHFHGHTEEDFLRVCNEFDRAASLNYTTVAFEHVYQVPPVNPQLAVPRNTLLKQVIARLTPHKKSLVARFFSAAPSKILGGTVDVVFHAAAVSGALVGGPALPFLLVGGKALWEWVTGKSTSDWIAKAQGKHGKSIGETWLLARAVKVLEQAGKKKPEEKSLSRAFGSSFLHLFRRAAVGGLGTDVGGASESNAPHGVHETHEEHQDIESIIRNACEQEMSS